MHKPTESAAPRGDGPADRGPTELFTELYGELRRLADRATRRQGVAAVSPTTIVHELFLDLSRRDDLRFAADANFLAYAGRAMRGLVIDFARRRQALKRGAAFHITQFTGEAGETAVDGAELARLSDALDELGQLEPRLAEVVDLKYFCGFTFAEIAALRGTSEKTVQRDWEKARRVLYRELSDE
jgi:RNA polymerase sigma factor (TIGR02999 family)